MSNKEIFPETNGCEDDVENVLLEIEDLVFSEQRDIDCTVGQGKMCSVSRT